MCYMHIGQHGSADYSYIVSKTKPSVKKEYKELLKELKEIGYKNLKVYRKEQSWMRHERYQNERNIMKFFK